MATRQLTKVANMAESLVRQLSDLVNRIETFLDYAKGNNIKADLPPGDDDPVAGAGSQTRAELIDQLRALRAVLKLALDNGDYDAISLGTAPTAADVNGLLKKLGL